MIYINLLTQQADPQGSIISLILPFLIFGVAIYFMLIKPQKKREKEMSDMRSSIKAGDNIITIGGILGKVVQIKEDLLVIEVGSEKNKMEITKWAVSSVADKKDIKNVEEPSDIQ